MTEQSPSVLRLVSAYRSEWASLVEIAAACRTGKLTVNIEELAGQAKKSTGAVIAKFAAITAALDSGLTAEQVIEKGEKEILSTKAKARTESAGGLVNLTFKVPLDLKECLQSDFQRISGVLGQSSNLNVLEWLHSVLLELTDADIANLGGVGKG